LGDVLIIALLAALVGVVVLGYLHRKDADLPPVLSHIGRFADLAALGLAGALAYVALSKRDQPTKTAGDVASDDLADIDDQTKEDIQDAPTEPDPDFAADADGVVQDAADDHDVELGDGFDSEPLVDTNDISGGGDTGDSPDVPLHDDLLPMDAD